MNRDNSIQKPIECILNTPVYSPSRRLAAEYQPSATTVVIGKGRIPKQAEGNRYLRSIVQAFLDKYSAASNKTVKSNIVSSIFASIYNNCSDGLAFVKYDGEYYWPVTDAQARDKIAGTFRDCLSHKYKSASKNKVAKRRQTRKKQHIQNNTKRQLEQEQHRIKPDQLLVDWITSMEPRPLPLPIPGVRPSTLFNPKSSIDDSLATPEPQRIRTFSIPSMMALFNNKIDNSIFDPTAASMEFEFPNIRPNSNNITNCNRVNTIEQSNISEDNDEDEAFLSSCSSTASSIFDDNYSGNLGAEVAEI
jgi:hypothetical protein